MGVLGHEISADLDVLYSEVHDALDDLTSSIGKRVRK
jgi:hypothetical protein